jgi:hypothetical protein
VDLEALSDDDLDQRYGTALSVLGLTDADLVATTADLVEQLSRIEVEHPLAYAVLWQRDDAPYDQRRVAASLVHPLSLVLGGNRGGKTYAIMESVVAFALGGDHPAVVAWLEANDLPRDLIPAGPGEVYCVTNSAALSIKIHRLDIAGLLPRAGVRWWGQNALAEARCEISVSGYAEPARIWFKSTDQGHRAFKGDQVRFVAISEEPEGDEGRLVLDECMRACAATGGRVVLEMTPQNGMTWVYDDLVEGGKYDVRIIELDSSNNVLVADHASLMRWLESLSDEERQMRQLGRFIDRRGLVYTGWARGDGSRDGMGHVVDDFPVPREWTRFRGVDFGLVNPTCVLWGALGDDEILYVYRELYEAGPTYREHAERVRELERGEVIEAGWGDPSARDAIDDWAGLDVYLDGANNAVQYGIDAVKNRLRVQSDGRPRLKVFRSCVNLIREIEGYVWDPRRRDPTPVKKKDHAADAMRYLVVGTEEWLGH